jgi:hypothetical protein
MTPTTGRLAEVRRFEEDRADGQPRLHLLAIYDTRAIRVLIDRSEGLPTRLLAVLKAGHEHEPGDGPAQVKAICDDYIQQYGREDGPLACRLTREHLIAPSRDQASAEIRPVDGEGRLVEARGPARTSERPATEPQSHQEDSKPRQGEGFAVAA